MTKQLKSLKKNNFIALKTLPAITTNTSNAKVASSTDADLAELTTKGYTVEEVSRLLGLGITPLVLKKLKNIGCELDIFQSIEVITTCISMGIPESQKAQDQDLVLMIGNTGAGKSTAINYLNGCEMERIRNNGASVIIVKESAAAQSIAEIGHGDSKTFIPTVIKSVIEQIAFCDCPGFSDNRGQEINISNAVNIRHTIEKAKSVKLIVLIDYASATDAKGTVIRGIIKTLDALFGEENSLMRHGASIQIGISKVPLSIDDEPVTLEDIQRSLDRHLPADIIPRIKILDPLDRRRHEQCTRTDWLAAINALTPVVNHQTVFKTILNAEDRLKLIDISNEMSQQINEDLSNGQYHDAAQKLEQMERLRIIGREAIEALYQDNLRRISAFAETLAQEVKAYADKYDWKNAYTLAKQQQGFIARFQCALPSLKVHFTALIDYISTKQVEGHTASVIQSADLMVTTFDQNISMQRRLAYSLHTLLSTYNWSLPEHQIRPGIPSILTALHAQDAAELRPVIEDLCDKLAALQFLAQQLDKNEIMNLGELHLIKALTHIAKVAQRVHQEMSLEALKNINIAVLQQMDRLKSKITWETNGRNILVILQSVKSEMSTRELIELLNPLKTDARIVTAIEILITQLRQASHLIADLNIDDDSMLFDETRKIFQIIHEFLLQIKSQLEQEKKAEETKLRKERDTTAVKSFIQKVRAMIQTTRINDFNANLVLLNTFNEEQLALLHEDKEISLLLIEKLHASFGQLRTKITWETNGRRVFNILRRIKDAQDESILISGLRELEKFDSINAEAVIIGFGFMILSKCKAKMKLDSKAYLSATMTHLTYIHGELDKQYAEELKRLRVNYLVTQINNRLIPNSEFAELNKAILNLLAIAPEQLQTITLKTKLDEHKRAFFEQLNVSNFAAVKRTLELLSECQRHLKGVLQVCQASLDINELITAIVRHLANELAEVQKELREAFSEESITTYRTDINPLKKLSGYFNACADFQKIEHVTDLSLRISEHCVTLLGSLIRQYRVNSDPNVYAKFLMQVECTAARIGSSNTLLSTRIRHAMGQMISKNTDIDFLGAVGFLLKSKAEEGNESSAHAEKVMADYPAFKRAENSRWRTATSTRSSADILSELEPVSKGELARCYDIYTKEYERIIQEIVAKFETPEDKALLSSIVAKARTLAKTLGSTTHYSRHPETIATLVAQIYGAWSYLDAHSGGFKSDRTTLREPHSSQVMSVLLLFGVDNSQSPIENHLLQVKTGEGKSVITAAAAIAFALVEYDVHIACYNPWLASRDERAFRPLFETFNLTAAITYGDFDTHIQGQLRAMGNIHVLTNDLLKNKSSQKNIQRSEKKQLLFIDEVDVFFSKSFLGTTYTPLSLLRSDFYQNLLVELWNNRSRYITMNTTAFCDAVSSLQLYKNFVEEYPNASQFLDSFKRDMHQGLIAVANDRHVYVVRDGRIGYEDKRSNSVNLIMYSGHYTAFAAVKEYQAQRVSLDYLNNHTAAAIICGSFSYAELPNAYQVIVGVTGTLFSLGRFEAAILENYNIRRKTAIPSVFNKHQLVDAEKVTVCAGIIDADDDNGYFLKIKRAVDGVIAKDRAVLLIFKDEERLKLYQKYIMKHQYAIKTIRTNTLLISSNDNTRDLIVAEAASRARVTEMPREFGRGSDFVCRDSQLRSKGGVAVICTFFPEDESEEVQIKGRTCRQSEPGSFEMILFLDDLKETYGVQNQIEISESPSSTYQFLVNKRNERQARSASELEGKIQSAKALHEKTVGLTRLLSSQSIFSFSRAEDRNTEALSILRTFN